MESLLPHFILNFMPNFLISKSAKFKKSPCKKLYFFGQNSNPTVGCVGYVGGLGFLKIWRKIQQMGAPQLGSIIRFSTVSLRFIIIRIRYSYTGGGNTVRKRGIWSSALILTQSHAWETAIFQHLGSNSHILTPEKRLFFSFLAQSHTISYPE